MRLTLRNVAKLLNVSEKTVHNWVSKGEIPSYRLKEQYRFSKAEIVEWAAARMIPLSEEPSKTEKNENAHLPAISEAIEAGGIHYNVEGGDKSSVLRAVVDSLKLPKNVDRDFLHRILLAREAMGSTGVGDGIAIPHVRNPIILNGVSPAVSLSFLSKPVEFDAVDGIPVRVLFTIISSTIAIHLHLISRLAFTLHDAECKKAVLGASKPEEIIRQIKRVEASRGGTK